MVLTQQYNYLHQCSRRTKWPKKSACWFESENCPLWNYGKDINLKSAFQMKEIYHDNISIMKIKGKIQWLNFMNNIIAPSVFQNKEIFQKIWKLNWIKKRKEFSNCFNDFIIKYITQKHGKISTNRLISTKHDQYWKLDLLPDTLITSVSQCNWIFQKIRSWRKIKRNVKRNTSQNQHISAKKRNVKSCNCWII
jgi:hypothetical protein